MHHNADTKAVIRPGDTVDVPGIGVVMARKYHTCSECVFYDRCCTVPCMPRRASESLQFVRVLTSAERLRREIISLVKWAAIGIITFALIMTVGYGLLSLSGAQCFIR